MQRRDFLKYSLGASATATGMLPSVSLAQSDYAFDDYRALVVVMLGGGNDAYNMLVPIGGSSAPAGTGYGTYSDLRRHLAVNDEALDIRDFQQGGTLNLTTHGNPYAQLGTDRELMYRRGYFPLRDSNGLALPGAASSLGLNSLMPELAELYGEQKLAVISNTGALVEPTTRASLDNSTAQLPKFLFAHNHQTQFLTAARNAVSDRSGWAGRMADLFAMPDRVLPLGVDVSGRNSGLFSAQQSHGFGLGSSLLFELNAARNIDHSRTQILDSLPNAETRSLFGRFVRDGQQAHYTALQQLQSAIFNAPDVTVGSDPYGNALFERPAIDQSQLAGMSGILFSQLRAIATSLAFSKERPELANRRQVYYAFLSGFDTHSQQVNAHSPLLRTVSMALWHFQRALENLGLADAVTTTVTSEFGRSLTLNDDGTDHGWGGHQLVMGQAVNGGQRLGQLADMRRGGNGDHGDKARLIPDTSQDQVHATLASWLGVRDADLSEVFPNLANFRQGSGIDTALLNNLMQA